MAESGEARQSDVFKMLIDVQQVAACGLQNARIPSLMALKVPVCAGRNVPWLLHRSSIAFPASIREADRPRASVTVCLVNISKAD
jgi:hypothetical protein